MADRYWVGGSGSWDATSTTNWSDTSGGAGGASAPTSIDDVYFDANSNTGTDAFTVTVTGTSASPANCRDFTASGLDGALTFTMGATAFLDCYGSFTLPATNFTVSGTAGAGIRFKATTTGKTFTTNGVSLSNVNARFDGVGGEWTLGSAYTSLTSITVANGTFNTSNFNVTALFINTSGTATRAINFGSSTLTFSGSTALDFSVNTGLTFNAGTSSIVCAANGLTFNGGGLTYYNVSFTSTASGTATITGANTFNDLTFTSLAVTGVRQIALGANQTVSGTLTFGTGNTAIRRMFVRSNVVGTPRTITLNGTLATLADVDFRDIVAAGTAGTWTGTRLGNCGGNTGITFDAGKTVYRQAAGNWSATQWSLSSGGAVDVNNFPLAQDTIIFDTNTGTGNHIIDGSWNLGNIDASALTVSAAIFSNTSYVIYGNVVGDAQFSFAGVQTITFSGVANQTYLSVGITNTNSISILKPVGTTFTILDNFTTNLGFALTQGTLDLNNNTLTCLTFSSNTSNTRSIAFGTGQINLTGNNIRVFDQSAITNFSYTGSGTINWTYSGAVGIREAVVGSATTEAQALNHNVTAGSDTIRFYFTFKTLNLTGFTGTYAMQANVTCFGGVTFPAEVTVTMSTFNYSFNATSGSYTITTGNNKTFNSVTFGGLGTSTATWVLQDNFTAANTTNFISGTLNINNNTLSTGLYSSTGTLTRQLDVGTGTLAVTGASFTASGSNYTTAGSGLVSMTSSSAKTFAGGGFTYPTLNQGGSGTLTITGANTFNNISNTLDGASTINFPANTITRVLNMKLRGGIGKLVSMRSSIDGTKYTIQT